MPSWNVQINATLLTCGNCYPTSACRLKGLKSLGERLRRARRSRRRVYGGWLGLITRGGHVRKVNASSRIFHGTYDQTGHRGDRHQRGLRSAHDTDAAAPGRRADHAPVAAAWTCRRGDHVARQRALSAGRLAQGARSTRHATGHTPCATGDAIVAVAAAESAEMFEKSGEPEFRQLEPDGGLVEADRRASERSVSPRDGCCVLP